MIAPERSRQGALVVACLIVPIVAALALRPASARVHGTLVGEIQDRTLQLTQYSPSQRLLSGAH